MAKRTAMKTIFALSSALFVVLAHLSTAVEFRIDAAHPTHPVSPKLYGVFFEDINFGADGGLVAELVKNSSLEIPKPLLGWKPLEARDNAETGDGEMTLSNDAPWRVSSPNYLHLVAKG